MLKNIRNAVVRRGVETAVSLTAEATATATTKSFTQLFEVTLPVTVYVRAAQCTVNVYHRPGTQIELSASLRASFGWEFVTEQNEDGVYVVARRKPIVGALSSAKFTLAVPPEANLVFHLTPGAVYLRNVDGKFIIPGKKESISVSQE